MIDLQDEVLEQKITGVDEDGNIDDVEASTLSTERVPMTEEEEYANAGITKEEAEKLPEIFQDEVGNEYTVDAKTGERKYVVNKVPNGN